MSLMLVMASMLVTMKAVADAILLHARPVVDKMQQLLFGKE
jgi:hypothetical protein